MNITTTRNALLMPLSAVAGVVEKKHTLPILANVLIEQSGDDIAMLATDLEIQIRTTGVARPDQSITVAARKLYDILKSLPVETEIKMTMDGDRIKVKAGKSRFTLQTLPAADYPRMTLSDDDATLVRIPQHEFKRMLGQVSYAMADKDVRYYLNGLLMTAHENSIRLVGTDGHRLAYTAVATQSDPAEAIAILPRKTVMELARQIPDSEDMLEIAITQNQAVFRFGTVEFASKLIDGKFPDFNRVIPRENPVMLTLDRAHLLGALSRVAILTAEKMRGVRLLVDNGVLRMMSSNESSEDAQEEIEIDYAGEKMDCGFNVTYLIEVLNNAEHDFVELHLKDSQSSALITVPGDDAFKYVVMPMRL
ncbi:MAG TPA: DNA polymerase III subunit beta [Orrella sp.]